jgi:fucose permease
VDKRVHVSLPIVATFVLGWATTSLQSIVTTFMVDVFPERSASAVANLNLARCLMGAGGTAAVLPLIDAIGASWAYTAVTALQVLANGLVVVQMRYGARRRRKREVKELEIEE